MNYDILKHYIAEGLIIFHRFPDPDNFDRTASRIYKTVHSVDLISDGMSLSILDNGIRVMYPITAELYERYATPVEDMEESVKLAGDAIEEFLQARSLVETTIK